MEKYTWLNEASRLFLDRGYLEEGISPEERFHQISLTAEKILKIKGFADKFEDYLSRGFYSLASPVISNFGNKRGIGCSCYGSFIPDTMEGIVTKAAEISIMTKNGGGTSGYFGDLRSRGSKISMGGESSGPVHFLEIFNTVSNVVSQSNVRRGSFAAYLPVEHPDIEEFLRIREIGHPIQEISIAVTITDNWMKEMIKGDKEKRRIWALIIKKRFESGYPYITFIDNVNNQAPQVYKDKGLKIVAQNLCVVGSERVVSDRGLLTAKELSEQGGEINLFDNKNIVKSSGMELIERDADVYRITLENGMSHAITSYHKVNIFDKFIHDKNGYKVLTKNTECKNLRIGDKVSIQTNKGISGNIHMPDEAFLLGLYQGDGTQYKDNIYICIWENDFDLISEIESKFVNVCNKYETQISKNNRKYEIAKFRECHTGFSKVRKKSLGSKALSKALNFKKGVIPDWVWKSDEETQWEYIKGLYFTDGTVGIYSGKGDAIQLSLANINREFLQNLQILMANLGMQTSIRLLRKAGETLLPDGRGGSKIYKTKDCWRLIIGNKNDALVFNQKTGFLDRKGLNIENRVYRNNTKKFYKISNIEYIGKEDVYCCQVDNDDHLWVCNGIITHNCNEIALYSSPEESFVCVLSSLNLLLWDEIIKTDAIETLIYFLDAVNEEFIQKTENMKFMEAANKFAKNQRALGMGVLGWHSLLQSKLIPFESMEAKLLNNKIFKTIRERADKATEELAKIFGEPELLKGYNRRNATTLTCPPTTSSSYILGQVSPSIEPLDSNYFVKKLAKGSFSYKNPYLIKLLEEKSKNSDEVWKSILTHGGSVQHLNFLDQREKDIFKTFSEISQKEIAIQAASRQKYIDQGQSLNFKIAKDIPAKEVSQLLIFCWEQGIKGAYYQRNVHAGQELSRSIMNCTSCEG